MSKHPLLLNQLLYFIKPTERGKIADLHLGDLLCIPHYLEVSDTTLNDLGLS